MKYDEIATQLEFYRDIGVTHLDVPLAAPPRVRPEAHAKAARSARPAAPLDSSKDSLLEILHGSTPMTHSRKDVGSLEGVLEELGDCQRCALAGSRTHIVFGAGNPSAQLLFVGEAPGAEEDRQGLPFVGRAGQLLTRIIESIGMSREEVYIGNVLKCRPPGNRNPEPVEVETCSPFLQKQIEAIQPRVVCCMGTFAAQTVLGMNTPISRLRGKFYEIGGIRYMATFHPAYLLRNPEKKREVWEDMKKIRAELMGR
jgi:DNA polymerase